MRFNLPFKQLANINFLFDFQAVFFVYDDNVRALELVFIAIILDNVLKQFIVLFIFSIKMNFTQQLEQKTFCVYETFLAYCLCLLGEPIFSTCFKCHWENKLLFTQHTLS